MQYFRRIGQALPYFSASAAICRHGRCVYDRTYRYAQFPAHPFSVAAAICRHGRCVYESSQRKARFPAYTLRLWRRRRRRYGTGAGRCFWSGVFSVYAAYVAAGCRRYGAGRYFWPGFFRIRGICGGRLPPLRAGGAACFCRGNLQGRYCFSCLLSNTISVMPSSPGMVNSSVPFSRMNASQKRLAGRFCL